MCPVWSPLFICGFVISGNRKVGYVKIYFPAKVRSHTLFPQNLCMCLCLYPSFSPFFARCSLCPKFLLWPNSPLWVMCGALWYSKSQKLSHTLTLRFPRLCLGPFPYSLCLLFLSQQWKYGLEGRDYSEGMLRVCPTYLLWGRRGEALISYCIIHLITGINCNAASRSLIGILADFFIYRQMFEMGFHNILALYLAKEITILMMLHKQMTNRLNNREKGKSPLYSSI